MGPLMVGIPVLADQRLPEGLTAYRIIAPPKLNEHTLVGDLIDRGLRDGNRVAGLYRFHMG
jgi:hypothetical protein